MDEPGTYKLCEDIVFNPFPPVGDETPAESYDVHFEGVYNRSSFGLGFFSAISVVASHVTIMLNGFTLEQSVEHSLMQRYFALIELANAPFIKDTGPAQFVSQGECFERAKNVNIIGPGTLGRSAHHGAYSILLFARFLLRRSAHLSLLPQEFMAMRTRRLGFKM